MKLRISLLGEQSIIDDATCVVRARPSRALALAAFLIAHAGSPQSRPRVAGLFWPGSPDAQALTNLRRELHHLRRVLGDDPALVVTPTDLCWADSATCRVDLRVFDVARRAALAALAHGDLAGLLAHADTALAAYRGDFLPGCYDDWPVEIRARLARDCAQLCEVLAVARVRSGDLTGAVDATRRLLALEPLGELGYRTMMALQAAQGDRAGALCTYRRCEALLSRELGVEPSGATLRELRRMLPEGAGGGRGERWANAAPIASGRTGAPGAAGAPREEDAMTTVDFQPLTEELRGDLITPASPEYDQARAVYNGMIDRRPAAVARCRDVADVMACVRFAVANGVEIAVRGGGHNAGGLGVWDDALVIDLSPMRSTTIDAERRTVRVDGGCVWGDVDHATAAFGMATPSGFLSSTGVGGLTLGGGIGYLARRFGLTIDNLLSADVVLADGSLVTADAEHHPDLYWALKGGGGNFGVVTSFTFQCHEIGADGVIYGGPVLYDIADTAEVMRWYRELVPTLPRELNGFLALLRVPSGPPFPEELWDRKACAIVWCYTGPHDRAEEALAPTREHTTPMMYGVQPMPFKALQSAFDPLNPPGMQWYWRSNFSTGISDEAIAAHVEHGPLLPTPQSTMHMYPIDGAVAEVPEDATAFSFRGGGWAWVIVGVDPDPAGAERITQWAKDYWDALQPTSAGSSYVNFMMDEGHDRVRASYGPNYERLAQVKRRYDPQNVFHVNQNILPAQT